MQGSSFTTSKERVDMKDLSPWRIHAKGYQMGRIENALFVVGFGLLLPFLVILGAALLIIDKLKGIEL